MKTQENAKTKAMVEVESLIKMAVIDLELGRIEMGMSALDQAQAMLNVIGIYENKSFRIQRVGRMDGNKTEFKIIEM